MTDDPHTDAEAAAELAKQPARQFRQIRSAMRRERPDWPAGLGEDELLQLDNGSPDRRAKQR
jgi:hypothetical protein